MHALKCFNSSGTISLSFSSTKLITTGSTCVRPTMSSSFSLLVLACCLAVALAGIGKLNDQPVNLKQLAGSRATMYTLEDTPLGSAQPYLQFNVSVTGNASAVWVIFAYSTYQRLLTHELSTGDNVICCSRAAINDGVKCEPNLPLYFTSNTVDGQLYRYWRIGQNETLVRRQNITGASGYYYIYFLNCQEDTNALLNGQIEWVNPFGYLSGALMPFMMVYLFLACCYFVLFVIWSAAMVYHRDTVVRVQLCIHATLLVSFCEYFIYSGDWGIYNYETGYIGLGWNIATVIVVAARAVIVSITALLIAMGYGLFRRTLERRTVGFIICAAVCVAVSTALSQIVQMLRYTPQTEDSAPPEWVEFLFVVIETLINFCVAIWSLYHLWQSSMLLKKHRQTAKLQLFRRLVAVVVFAIIAAVLIFLVDFFSSATGQSQSYWRAQALFGTAWPLLWLLVIIAIVALFFPNNGNQLFTMFQLPDEDPDLEMRSARNEPASERTSAPAAAAAAASLATPHSDDDEAIAPVADAADDEPSREDNDDNNAADDNDKDEADEEEEEEEEAPKASSKNKKKKKKKQVDLEDE